MEKGQSHGNEMMTLCGGAKQGKASSAPGQSPEHDTGVMEESERPALDTSTDQSPEDLSKLGWSHLEEFRRLGRLNDLEKSIEYRSRALALTPDGHPNISDRHASLGVSYGNRFQRLGELADLEKAMECDSRALASTPDGHPNMSDRTYLEKAIGYFSHALASTPDGHPNISDRHASLGVSYGDRFQRLGELADLEKAMEYFSHALAYTPDDHPNLPARHFNQGLGFFHHYNHTAQPSHLHHSLDSFRKASQVLTGSPRDKFQNALKWANLAQSHGSVSGHNWPVTSVYLAWCDCKPAISRLING
ncbi:hypothetical protein RSAG8_13824, partial [Rhizoctonia solani AG-8 WAC10335]